MDVKAKDDISKQLHISLPLTEANLGYKFNLDISDDDIYHFIGRKAAQGIEAPLSKMQSYSDRKKARANWGREELIEYAKTSLMPLVPDNEEFIPRKYWCSFDELLGANLNNESHPVWQLSHQIVKDNYVKNSDTMLIQACGNFKPYIDNTIYQYSLRKYREGYFDLFITSWEVTPIDFSPFFPWRYYDWNHAKETPFMTATCVNHEFRNICDFVEYFNYKRLILFSPGIGDKFYTMLNERLENHFKDSKVEYIFIWDEKTLDRAKKELGIHMWGILKTRYNNLKPGREKLEKLIGYDPNKKFTSDKDYKYGIKNKDLIRYLRRGKDNWYMENFKTPRKRVVKSNLWED